MRRQKSLTNPTHGRTRCLLARGFLRAACGPIVEISSSISDAPEEFCIRRSVARQPNARRGQVRLSETPSGKISTFLDRPRFPCPRNGLQWVGLSHCKIERLALCHYRWLFSETLPGARELRLRRYRVIKITEWASKAIPRCPAFVRGVAFSRHGSCPPRDQGIQAFSRNDGPAANADGFQLPSGNKRINARLA